MGETTVADGVDLTEFEAIEVERVDGVKSAANGFTHLLMKGLGDAAKADADGDADSDSRHDPMTGTHAHPHPAFSGPDADGDGQHGHSHVHDNDAVHDHPHATGTGAGVKAVAAAARILVQLARSVPAPHPSAADVWASAHAFAPEVMAKAVVGGQVDEGPDIDGGKQAIALIAKLISYEADELAAGCLDEIRDIETLCQAADCLRWWLGREQAGQAAQDAYGQDGTGMDGMMISSAWAYEPDEVAKDSREFSVADRKKHAAAGHALPDGSYPVPDADALRRAAVLARSKHGNWQAAKRLIAKRAKELGVANPLDDDKDDAGKGTVADGGADVDTDGQGSESAAKALADAVTKAMAPLKDELSAVKAELAKVKATPIPGGPVLSAAARQTAAPAQDDHAAKAAYYAQMADTVSDRQSADGYRILAREYAAKAKDAPPT